jgi:muconolactone D-isomerase
MHERVGAWVLRSAALGSPTRAKFSTVEFLVEIEVRLPPDLDGERRLALLDAEFARGSALAQAGLLRAIWRVPGRLANRAIWAAPDATVLHDALVSLPLWPYMDVTVTPLARHALAEYCPGVAVGAVEPTDV